MIPRAIRIYDKHSKSMFYPKQGTDRGVFVGMDGYPMQFDGKSFFKLDDCVPMYATGIKARGGIMIWEGDIVECDVPVMWGMNTQGMPMSSFIKERGVMSWDERGGNWFIRMKQGMHPEGQVGNLNVVGNIYEHKELLKDEN